MAAGLLSSTFDASRPEASADGSDFKTRSETGRIFCQSYSKSPPPTEIGQQRMVRKTPLASRFSRGKRRRGVAVVELAVCLPVLVLILLSTIEACVMLQLKQNVTITAYEAHRIGIMPGIEASAVQFQCEMLLDDRHITDYTITMDPAGSENHERRRPVHRDGRGRLQREFRLGGRVL